MFSLLLMARPRISDGSCPANSLKADSSEPAHGWLLPREQELWDREGGGGAGGGGDAIDSDEARGLRTEVDLRTV